MAHGAWTIGTYPLDLVRIACAKCGRRGKYRRVTLLDRYDLDMAMPDPVQCSHRGNWSDPCLVILRDLVKH